MSFHPGQTATLSTTELARAKTYVWTLWDGRVITTLVPHVDVVLGLNDWGALEYSVMAVAPDATSNTVTGAIAVDHYSYALASIISGNGSAFGSMVAVDLTLDQTPASFSWTYAGAAVTGMVDAVEVELTANANLRYTYTDAAGTARTLDFFLYGYNPATVAVSEIDLSPVRARSISGKYLDLRVLALSNLTCAWDLGGYTPVSVPDAEVNYGRYTQYHARVAAGELGPATTDVSFTASDSHGSVTRHCPLPIHADAVPVHDLVKVTLRQGTTDTVLATGSAQYATEAGTLIFSVSGLADPAWDKGQADLVTASWAVTAGVTPLPTLYGPSASLSLAGLGGRTLHPVLTLTDNYGSFATVTLDEITVSLDDTVTTAVTVTPTPPSKAGVPLVVTAGTKAWSGLTRQSSVSYDFSSSWTGTAIGNSYVLPTTGRGGRSAAVAVTATNYAGRQSVATATPLVADTLPAGIFVWNDAPGNKAAAGSVVHFYACSVDPDGDTPLTFEWHFSNPISLQTGATATIDTGSYLTGTIVTGTVYALDPTTSELRATATATSLEIPGVLVLSSLSGGSTGTGTGNYPICPVCTGASVQLVAPTLSVSGPATVKLGLSEAAAFVFRYSGLSITEMRRTIVGDNYSCDSGWVSAPSPTTYRVYEDWGPAFSISSACPAFYSAASPGAYTITLYVRQSDGSEHSADLDVDVEYATFTNTHQGVVTVACAAGSCGAGSSIEVIAGYDVLTTNQTYTDLGLDPVTSSVAAAQAAVNAKATALATTRATALALAEPACYAVPANCVCAVIGDALNTAISEKFEGDELVVASAAAVEVGAGTWTDYVTMIGDVIYTVVKTQVTATSARLCLSSAIALPPGDIEHARAWPVPASLRVGTDAELALLAVQPEDTTEATIAISETDAMASPTQLANLTSWTALGRLAATVAADATVAEFSPSTAASWLTASFTPEQITAGYALILVDNEVMILGALTATGATTVTYALTRGAYGTTAALHTTDATVWIFVQADLQRWTSALLEGPAWVTLTPINALRTGAATAPLGIGLSLSQAVTDTVYTSPAASLTAMCTAGDLIYVAASDQSILKVDQAGIATTLTATTGYTASRICADAAGNVYFYAATNMFVVVQADGTVVPVDTSSSSMAAVLVALGTSSPAFCATASGIIGCAAVNSGGWTRYFFTITAAGVLTVTTATEAFFEPICVGGAGYCLSAESYGFCSLDLVTGAMATLQVPLEFYTGSGVAEMNRLCYGGGYFWAGTASPALYRLTPAGGVILYDEVGVGASSGGTFPWAYNRGLLVHKVAVTNDVLTAFTPAFGLVLARLGTTGFAANVDLCTGSDGLLYAISSAKLYRITL